MATETQQTTYGVLLKALSPGDFVTLDDRPKNGGSLQARKLSTGDVRFYFRYSQLNEETQASEKIRKAIGIWDPTAPPKMRTASPRGFSVAAALEKCAELGALQSSRKNTGGLKEVDIEERRVYLTKKAARAELSQRSLQNLLAIYIDHLKLQGRRSWTDAAQILGPTSRMHGPRLPRRQPQRSRPIRCSTCSGVWSRMARDGPRTSCAPTSALLTSAPSMSAARCRSR